MVALYNGLKSLKVAEDEVNGSESSDFVKINKIMDIKT